VATLAAVLDFQFQDAAQVSRSETQQMLDYLGHKQMLLVMDNFEHLQDGRTLLAEIMAWAPKIKLLVTSRERLQLRGEQLFPLQGLEMPQTGDSAEEAAAGYAAAQLFLNISKRSLPEFELLQGDAVALLRICRLVEGMPLGLELAASWAGLMPLSSIADEIEQSFRLLTTEFLDVPERHRSMQAALEVSWRRLSAEQKLGFQGVTVFRGGFKRQAALEIAGATLPLLVTLVNKSWLSYDREKDRYNIHELLRQYGASQLASDIIRECRVRDRHSAYFCGYLKEREADWIGPRQKDAAFELRDEIDNIQIAWRQAARQGDGDLLAQGLNGLCRYYHWEGRMSDGQNACRSAADGLSRSLTEQHADGPQLLALWSQVLAWETEFVSNITQKEKLLAKSQDLLDRVTATGRDTRAEQAFIFLEKAFSAGSRDFEEAVQFTTLGLELYRELGDLWGEAKVLGLLGGRYVLQGAYERANELLHDSLVINRQLEDTEGIAQTILYLGISARHQGDFEEAESLHRESLNLFHKLAYRRSERISLSQLSHALSWAGKFNAAKEFGERGAELDRDLGLYPNPPSLIPLTHAIIHLGRFTEAQALLTESLEIARQGGILTSLGLALMYLGYAAFAEGDLDKAERSLLESAALVAKVMYYYQALPRAILSYVFRAQGDDKLARDQLIGALRLGIEYRSISSIMYCLPAAALLAVDDSQPSRAVELYSLAQQFDHITNSRWFEKIACRELDGVMASMSPEAAASAQARGREMDLWETAEELLLELASQNSSVTHQK
jgi:predicted ATPase